MPAPSHSGNCQPASYKGRAQVDDVLHRNDPTRASDRNTPVASAIPPRPNHSANPATSAMKIDPSATPKINRPSHISQYGLPIAVRTAPTTPIAAVHNATRAAP